MVGVPCDAVPAYVATPADAEAVAACADEIWRGSAPPPAGDHGRRRGPALRARGQGRRAHPPAGHPGGHHLHGPRPAHRHRRAFGRHLSRRRRRSRGHRAGRRLGRPAAPGRDPQRHQFRRQRRQARPAPDDAGAGPPGQHGPPRVSATSRWRRWSTRCSSARRPLGRTAPAPHAPSYPRGLVADDAADRAGRHRPGRQRPVRPPRRRCRSPADVGDCLFTAMEIAHTDLTAPGYYAGMGYRRAGRARRCRRPPAGGR